jgi:hypothetical protein
MWRFTSPAVKATARPNSKCCQHAPKLFEGASWITSAIKMEISLTQSLSRSTFELFATQRADHPEAANQLVKLLRQVLNLAVANDLLRHNPAKEVPYIRAVNASLRAPSIS